MEVFRVDEIINAFFSRELWRRPMDYFSNNSAHEREREREMIDRRSGLNPIRIHPC
jgi:hypothetical protein